LIKAALETIRLKALVVMDHKMAKKRITTVLAGLCTLCTTLSFIPNPATAETLESAMISAYLSNPTLSAQRASVRASDEAVVQAVSNWRPTVEFSASSGVEVNESSLRTGSGKKQTRNPSSCGIDLSQPLFRGVRTEAETSGAENTVKADRARLTSIEQDILLSAATAYLDVYRDEAVLDLNRNNEAVLIRQLEATQDRFQVGEITRTDVHQAEARLANTTADRIQSEATLASSWATYQNVIGNPPTKGLKLPPFPSGAPDSSEAAIKEAALNNPDVIAAQYDERAAIDSIDTIWGELLPEVEFTASANRNLNSASESSTIDSYDALINLTVPLYQSGSVYSRLRESKQSAAESRLRVDLQRRNAAELASRSWETLQSAKARVTSFRTAIKAATIAFEGVEREAAVGSRTVLDVLDAEQELLDARVSFIRAQRDESVTMYELLSAMGKLTAHHLQLPVELYDPESHYQEIRDLWMGENSTGGLE
jgi:outer membrane protein